MKIKIMQMGVDLKNGKYPKVAFTGHRPDKLGGYDSNNAIRTAIRKRLHEGCVYLILNCETVEFMSGMAQGVDQDAVDVILEIIQEGKPGNNGKAICKLHAAIPYFGQDVLWPKETRAAYANQLDCIEDQCYFAPEGEEDEEYVHYVHNEKPKSKWDAVKWLDDRNHYMVDWCDLLIAVWDGSSGGTGNCVDYAKKIGKPILWLKLVEGTEAPSLPKKEAMKKVTLYTDGSCSGNPGPGGYAAILMCDGQEKVVTGGEKNTTNNRMELMGAIEGLKALKKPCEVAICSDSKYLVDGINKGWAANWKKNNWIKVDRKKASNHDLWDELLKLLEIHKVTMYWTNGHAGNAFNERCDKLAVAETNKQK